MQLSKYYSEIQKKPTLALRNKDLSSVTSVSIADDILGTEVLHDKIGEQSKVIYQSKFKCNLSLDGSQSVDVAKLFSFKAPRGEINANTP